MPITRATPGCGLTSDMAFSGRTGNQTGDGPVPVKLSRPRCLYKFVTGLPGRREGLLWRGRQRTRATPDTLVLIDPLDCRLQLPLRFAQQQCGGGHEGDRTEG